MDEQDFWVRLEFRICGEFAGFADVRLRRFWCDGLIAEEYDFTAPEPWSALLPSAGSTGRLSPHPETRSMTIDPLSGYPD